MDNFRKILKRKFIGNERDKEGQFHIGFGVDEGYARHMLVSIVSFCENNDAGRLAFHIITDGFSDEVMNALAETVDRYGTCAYVYVIDSEGMSLPIRHRQLSIATYFRFFLPMLMENVPRLLYADADVICVGGILELEGMEFEEHVIAAVPDVHMVQKRRKKELGIGEGHQYINAGVIYIDIYKWNRENIFQKTWDTLSRLGGKIKYEDQDVINVMLKGRIKYLPIAYNCMDMRKENLQGVKILHFAAHPKPWSTCWRWNPNCHEATEDIYSSYETAAHFMPARKKEAASVCMKYFMKRILWKVISRAYQQGRQAWQE